MKKAIVLHTDILGFREMTMGDDPDNPNTLLLIQETIKHIKEDITRQWSWYLAETDVQIEYKTFSDNMYVSAQYNEDKPEEFAGAFYSILQIARKYQRFLLISGTLCRGGISFGQDYNSEHIIYSQALVKAYNIETETAVFPRIVIDQELINGISTIRPKSSDRLIYNIIVKDWADIYFVNMINDLTEVDRLTELDMLMIREKMLHELAAIINTLNRKLSAIQVSSVQQKYKWLIQFLTWLNNDPTLLHFEFINLHEKISE